MELELDKMKLDDDSEKTGFFDMPYEMRRIVIDYMNLQSKGVFAQFSEQCLEEVQLSKNVAVNLEIKEMADETIDSVYVNFATNDYDEDFPGENFVVCNTTVTPENENALADFRSQYGEVLLLEVDSKERLTEFILQNFRGLWMILKSSLKRLTIDMVAFPYDQMKLGNLHGLQQIKLSANLKNNQIDPIRSGFIDFEQLRLIQTQITIPSLTIDQIFQLKASDIEVGYEGGQLYDLEQILNRIIGGELHENVKYLTIKPKHCLENVSGVFAKRMRHFMREYLVKSMDKMIIITVLPCGLTIDTAVLTDINQTIVLSDFFETEWTIL